MTKGRKQAKTPPWLPRAEWIVAALIGVAALYLHFTFYTHAGPLWRDEVNSVDFASMPLGEAHASLRYDSFPLLSTVLLGGWMHAGGAGDGALRLYGLIVGVLFLGAVLFAGRALGGGPPLLALALVGLNPWVVRTVDSIRPYGWGIVFIVATLGCAWNAVRTSKPLWLLLTALAAVASVQCMYQNAFLLAPILVAGAFVAWRASDRKTAVGLLGAGAVAAASLVVYLPAIRGAGEWGMLIRTHIPWARIGNVLADTVGRGGTLFVLVWSAMVILALASALSAIKRKDRNPVLFSGLALLLAAVAFLGVIRATHVQTEPWYYVPLVAVAGTLLEGALRERWRIGRVVLAVAVAGAVFASSLVLVSVRWTSADVAASKVAAAASSEDLIVLNPFWIGMTFQRYYHGAAPWITVPPMGDLKIVRYDRFKQAMTQTATTQPVLDAMTRTLQAGHRVYWVEGMNSGPSGAPPRILPPAPLPESGWFLGPYLQSWGRQCAHYLESHGLKANVLDVSPGTPVMGYEALTVTEVSGWH